MIPVIILLLLFLLKALIDIIGFFGEYSQQLYVQRKTTDMLNGIDHINEEATIQDISKLSRSEFCGLVSELINHSCDPEYCQRLVANYEVDVEKILGKSRTLIKFGPMLGLMGTLIPMGPALVGLASGDIGSMAYNMQMAFATTVVGMFIAAVGVAILQFRKGYYARQLNDLEFICQTLIKIRK